MREMCIKSVYEIHIKSEYEIPRESEKKVHKERERYTERMRGGGKGWMDIRQTGASERQ